MKCPFCAEEIKDQAFVCRHCGRDLSILRFVYEELRAAQEELTELKTCVAALSSSVAQADTEALRPAAPAEAGPAVGSWLRAFFVPLVGLLLVYWLIAIGLDTRPWILRLALILAAAAAAILDPDTRRRHWSANLALATALGIASILAMDLLDYRLRGAPFASTPADMLEELSYMASVALSFTAGVLALRLAKPSRISDRQALSTKLAAVLVTKLGSGLSRAEDLQKHVQVVQIYINTSMLLGTSLTALATGLHHLLK